MSASWIVGLVLAFNLAVLLGGVIWMRRQVKRVAAEQASEYRGLFKLEPLPPPGEAVQILVEDDAGAPSELQAVHRPHLGWVDVHTLLPIEDDVLGWRRHPFRTAPADVPSWSPERLDAELARLASEDNEREHPRASPPMRAK